MRLRWWLMLGLLVAACCSGCAKLNEWLEGTVGEEEKTDEETPEEKLDKAAKDLKGTDAAKRAAAVNTIMGLVLPDDTEREPTAPLATALPYLADEDENVVLAVLDGMQTKTGFAEKTEDEQQLDPEGYQRQLAEKRMVAEQTSIGLARALRSPNDTIRYRAIIVLCNLARPPIVPDDAIATLGGRYAAQLLTLAQGAEQPLDVRLLAIEALVAYQAGSQVAELVPLLRDPEPQIRARAALAFSQAADWNAAGQAQLGDQLVALVADKSQPVEVRWCAAAAAGRLQVGAASQLQDPFDEPVGLTNLEAYRTYALANAGGQAAQAVAQLNAEISAFATKEEEELDAERKKGYR